MREAEYLARELADAKAALCAAVRTTVAGVPIAAALARHPIALLGVVALGAGCVARRGKWLARPFAASMRFAKSTAWKAVLPLLLDGWRAMQKRERHG